MAIATHKDLPNGPWRNDVKTDHWLVYKTFVSYDDDSLILPGGSNTIIDMSIPTEQQKKQFRGYYGYSEKMKQENTTFGKRTNLDNNEMQNALEDSGASTVKISNVFSKFPAFKVGLINRCRVPDES